MRKYSFFGKCISLFWILPITALFFLLSQIHVLSLGNRQIFLGLDGIFSFLENRTIDARFKFRGSKKRSPPIIYVNVDSAAISAYGNLPWSRVLFAKTIDALFKFGNVKAIGFDFIFSDNGIPNLGREEARLGSVELGRSIAAHKNVVLIAAYGSDSSSHYDRSSFPYIFDSNYSASDSGLPELPSFPVVGPSWGTIGLANQLDDGRFVPFFAHTETFTYYPFSLHLALMHWGLDANAVSVESKFVHIRNKDGDLIATIPLLLGQLVEVNWFSSWRSEEDRHVSIASVIEYGELAKSGSSAEQAEAAEFFSDFRDATIFIGPTDFLLKDLISSPIDSPERVPGISVHGNMFKTIVSGRLIVRTSAWINFLVMLGGGVVASSLCLHSKLQNRFGKLAFAVLLVSYCTLAFWIFVKWDILLPIAAPIGVALASFVFSILWEINLERSSRRRVSSIFGSYVSPQVVDKMLQSDVFPEVGGMELEISAFFSDIEMFARIAEGLSPSELVSLMSEYLEQGTAVIIQWNGTLDKYVGDAIVAFFGAPLRFEDHSVRACRAALGVQRIQKSLCTKWLGEGDRWPERVHQMRTRIGISSGLAVVGNLGSPLRFNYTMMGDNVNVAQRLEGAAAYFGVDILVSESTAKAAVERDSDLVFRYIDRIRVAGRKTYIDIYELVGTSKSLSEGSRKCIEYYDSGIRFYSQRSWRLALDMFSNAVSFETRLDDKNPSKIMMSRMKKFLDEEPPSDWDFVFSIRKSD